MEAFVAAMCLAMGLNPCPEIELTVDKPVYNFEPAWAWTYCGLEETTGEPMCQIKVHEETFYMEERVAPGTDRSIGENIVIHELCHAYQFIRLRAYPDHRTAWKRCMIREGAWGAWNYDYSGRMR